MNNGCQKSNGCGADKEGWEVFNTFFCLKINRSTKVVLAITIEIYVDILNQYENPKILELF